MNNFTSFTSCPACGCKFSDIKIYNIAQLASEFRAAESFSDTTDRLDIADTNRF